MALLVWSVLAHGRTITTAVAGCLLHALGWLRPVLSIDVSKLGLVGSHDSVYCCRMHPSLTVRKQSKGSSLQSRPLVLLDLSLLERYSPPCLTSPSARAHLFTCPTPHCLLALGAISRTEVALTLSQNYPWACSEVLLCVFFHGHVWSEVTSPTVVFP